MKGTELLIAAVQDLGNALLKTADAFVKLSEAMVDEDEESDE